MAARSKAKATQVHSEHSEHSVRYALCGRSLRRGFAAARLLRLWVRISPGTWMFVVSVVFDIIVVNEEAMTHYETVAPEASKQTNKVTNRSTTSGSAVREQPCTYVCV